MDDKAFRMARRMVETLEEKKGEDILLLDLDGLTSLTDYFVICSAGSERTLKALSNEVRRRMKDEFSGSARGAEGSPESGWILLDYGDVILHLFSPALRRYYDLEELWDQARVLVHVK